MKRSIPAAVIAACCFLCSCNDTKSPEGPLAFSMESGAIEFLDRISPAVTVPITSGNGQYEITIIDDKVVEAELVQTSNSASVRFTPKEIGTTIVTVMDVIGYDYKRIPVTVYETGIILSVYDIVIEIEADTPALEAEIEYLVIRDLPFLEKYSYLLSDETKGVMTIRGEKDEFLGRRTFEHTGQAGDHFLGLTDDIPSRMLQVVRDKPTGSHSYTSFYGLTSGGGTRDEAIVSPEVWYLEDLTEFYDAIYTGRVTEVTVTYACKYQFAPFIAPEDPGADN